MRRALVMLAAGLVVAATLTIPAPARAAGTAAVSAEARCLFSGAAIGNYELRITLRNDTDMWATIVHSQVTGVVTGPTGLADGGSGDPGAVVETYAGPFPGDAVGPATVTFDLRLQAQAEGTVPPASELVSVSATVLLDGRCQGPGPDDIFSATVSPTVVPVGGTVVVSGGHCPPAVGWNLGVAPKWIVRVELAQESRAMTTPPSGSGYEAVGWGYGPPPFPGSVSATTNADPQGNWSVALDLSSTDQHAPPGSYAIAALCIGGNGIIGSIVYDTPRITVTAPGSMTGATPVVVRPTFTG
jgi:hypothetical protein